MRKLTVCLKNCYGIKKLDKEFVFDDSNVIAIYAPNGVMKTSFLKTLADIENPKKEKATSINGNLYVDGCALGWNIR